MSSAPHPSSVTLADRLGVHARVGTILDVVDLSPAFRAITIGGVSALAGEPGNDVMIAVDPQRPQTRRRYSVRAVDGAADTITLWVATGHEGPGSDWARRVQSGEPVDVVGPRGKITLDHSADWYLFAGDVSALAASYRMAEDIELPGKVIFLVGAPDVNDIVTTPLPDGLGVTGIFVEARGDASSIRDAYLGGLAALELPEHQGHVYLFGEFSVNKALKAALLDRGLDATSLTEKAFWRLGRANADRGEPEKD